MLQITAIPAFNDNYIWALHNDQDCIIVDPGMALPVMEFLKKKQLTLVVIFITHSHLDHIGGIEALLHQFPVPVYGNPIISGISNAVYEGDNVNFLGNVFSVIAIPGHTLDHLAWYCADEKALFCGDTLFGAGCGRIFDGTPELLFSSLQKLAILPASTRVYCAHEYTMNNLRFARTIEPDNKAIEDRWHHCEKLIQKGYPTVPFLLEDELQTNPFLRIREKNVIAKAHEHGAQTDFGVDIFVALRKWKNTF